MQNQIIQKLIKINNDFYKNIEDDFDTTRQYAWKGWGRVVEILKSDNEFMQNTTLNFLDLGCGNGRFFQFLNKTFNDVSKQKITFSGIDSNEFLLNKAKNNFPKQNWINFDLITNFKQITINQNTKFDVVTMFGLTHHIPDEQNRYEFFKNIAQLVTNNGYLIFTNWNFTQLKNQKIITNYKTISNSNLEEGDFFVGWAKKSNVFRYCHQYTKNEIQEILKIMQKNHLKLIERFESDGKGNNLNEYFILKKQTNT